MALDAVSLMRARVRGTPSWPGHDPETGYVGADRSDHSQKLLADGAGHTFYEAAAKWLRDEHKHGWDVLGSRYKRFEGRGNRGDDDIMVALHQAFGAGDHLKLFG